MPCYVETSERYAVKLSSNATQRLITAVDHLDSHLKLLFQTVGRNDSSLPEGKPVPSLM